MKTRFAALLVATVAVLLAGSLTDGRAIGITNPQGRMIELGSLTGVVSHVDLSKHKFTLTWKGKGALKMERYWPSYREDYQFDRLYSVQERVSGKAAEWGSSAHFWSVVHG